VTPRRFEEDEEMRAQGAASILLLRVALRLLGEARLRGNFGEEEELAGRAVALADELTGGAPSPDPRRALVEVGLIRPDRIRLSAPHGKSRAVTESLMLDGTLYDGGGVTGYGFVKAEPRDMSDEETAELERRRAEWRARMERQQQFTATRFLRAIAPPPQPDSSMPILAVLLFEDGFYVETTYDQEAPAPLDPGDLDTMTSERFLAMRRDEKPEITVTDDVGTEYFESGGGGRGGVRVSHASQGFAPAPPPSARVLGVTAGTETVELDLSRATAD
jgi:hypothetical protein